MRNRTSIGAGALLALMLASGTAQAQFTTVTAPRRAPEPVSPLIAEQTRQRSDSVAKETLSDMKAWVDSAAANIAAVPRPAMQDTVGAAVGPDTANAAARRTTTRAGGEVAFQEGARAPDTATSLPLVVLFGFGALGIGALILGRSRQTSLLQWARRARRSGPRS